MPSSPCSILHRSPRFYVSSFSLRTLRKLRNLRTFRTFHTFYTFHKFRTFRRLSTLYEKYENRSRQRGINQRFAETARNSPSSIALGVSIRGYRRKMSLTGTNERTMTYAEAAAKHPEVSRVAAIGKEAEERAEYAPRQRQEIIGVNATARILKGCVRLRARGMSPTEVSFRSARNQHFFDSSFLSPDLPRMRTDFRYRTAIRLLHRDRHQYSGRHREVLEETGACREFLPVLRTLVLKNIVEKYIFHSKYENVSDYTSFR